MPRKSGTGAGGGRQDRRDEWITPPTARRRRCRRCRWGGHPGRRTPRVRRRPRPVAAVVPSRGGHDQARLRRPGAGAGARVRGRSAGGGRLPRTWAHDRGVVRLGQPARHAHNAVCGRRGPNSGGHGATIPSGLTPRGTRPTSSDVLLLDLAAAVRAGRRRVVIRQTSTGLAQPVHQAHGLAAERLLDAAPAGAVADPIFGVDSRK